MIAMTDTAAPTTFEPRKAPRIEIREDGSRWAYREGQTPVRLRQPPPPIILDPKGLRKPPECQP